MQQFDNSKEIAIKFESLINGLTYGELVILNRMTVDRIRLMHKAGALMHMSQFNVGDTVSWTGNDGKDCSGVIIRLNQKTASVKTKDQGHWNISPQLLRKEGTMS